MTREEFDRAMLDLVAAGIIKVIPDPNGGEPKYDVVDRSKLLTREEIDKRVANT